MTVSSIVAGISVRALLFAQLRGRFGADELVVSLPGGSTGRDLRAWFVGRNSKMDDLLVVCRLAVNGDYVSWETSLADGDEVVIIPPVSGG